MVTIGQIIRDIRKRKGLTQAALGEAAGLSTMSVRRYESGERVIPEPTLNEISKALGENVMEALASARKKEDDEKFAGLAHVINAVHRQEKNRLDIPLEMSYDFLHQTKTISLLYSFNHLNDEGKSIAVERIEELALIPKYQRTDPV